jgi:hypothetical protein
MTVMATGMWFQLHSIVTNSLDDACLTVLISHG